MGDAGDDPNGAEISAQTSKRICAHMNDDHAVTVYAMAKEAAKRFARAGTIALVGALILLTVPLGLYLQNQMEEGRAQPLGHPVARHVAQTATDYVEKDADVRVMFMARSSVRPLMVVYLASRRTLKKSYIHGLRDKLREAVNDDELEIAIIGVRWSDETDKDDEKND